MNESIVTALIASGGALLGSIVGTIATLVSAKITAKRDMDEATLKMIFPIRMRAYQNVIQKFNAYIDGFRSSGDGDASSLLSALSDATLVAGDLAKWEIGDAYRAFLPDEPDERPQLNELLDLMDQVREAMNKDLDQFKLPQISPKQPQKKGPAAAGTESSEDTTS